MMLCLNFNGKGGKVSTVICPIAQIVRVLHESHKLMDRMGLRAIIVMQR